MSAAPPPQKKLTKKEKKALAFRSSKGKQTKVVLNEDDAVPEGDDLTSLEAAGGEQPVEGGSEGKSKKRKRAQEDEGAPGEEGKEESKEGGEGGDEQPKKKKRQRGKTPAQRAREAREKEGGAGGASGAEGAHRLLLFVGNLPYKVTVEEIQEHFKPCGETPTVRLLTPKSPSPSSPASSSKGCAFLEFLSPTSLQSALRLHHSTLQSRKINVELTAGGGGNSESRRKKIEEQRKKLEGEREKAARNKRLREGEGEDGDKTGRWKLAAAKQAAKEGGGAVEGADGEKDGGAEKPKKKVRDRRAGKPGAQGGAGAGKKEKEQRLPKASSGANAIKLASGWGNRAAK
ncbi:hypothetical protein JCM8547_002732 [Rhodosporidiobolus lusitaniae]